MNLNDLFTEEKVRLDPKCWKGKKIGNPKTKVKGGVRVNNCVPAESVAEGVMHGAENLHVGDDVVITGDVELNGATGVIDSFGQDKRFVVVNLYNHGKHSFHSSDVSANDYDNDEHDDDMAEGTLDEAVGMIIKGAAISGPDDQDIADRIAARTGGRVDSGSRGHHILITYPTTQDRAMAAVKIRKMFPGIELYKSGGNRNAIDEQGVAEGMWDQHQSIPELEKAIENLIMGYKGGINLTDKGRAQLLLSINKGKRILAKKKQQQDMAEGGIATVGWPDEGNHTGNNPPVSIGGVSMPQLSVGDQVKYFGDKATVVGLSQDRKRARIRMPDRHITQNVDTADLTRLGQGDYANKKPLPGVAEGEQQKGADYRDPKEVDYDDEYDAMVARVKKLAGLGPLKTVYDPNKRQYRNMPTAVQPKK